jgi:hypothetical protein
VVLPGVFFCAQIRKERVGNRKNQDFQAGGDFTVRGAVVNSPRRDALS